MCSANEINSEGQGVKKSQINVLMNRVSCVCAAILLSRWNFAAFNVLSMTMAPRAWSRARARVYVVRAYVRRWSANK